MIEVRKFIISIYLILFCSINAAPLNYLEVGLGYHKPQSEFSKYADTGLSLFLTGTKSFNEIPFIRTDIGLRYIHFKTDNWDDGWALTSGDKIPVEVENRESSLAVLFGMRIMNPTKRGAFRPYAGLKFGLFNFSEKTRYDWGPNAYWSYDWQNDEWEYNEDDTWAERIDDSRHYAGWMLEFGTSIYAARDWGFDIGIQYDIIPGLIKSELNGKEGDDSTIEISSISRKINADYISVHFGISIPVISKK